MSEVLDDEELRPQVIDDGAQLVDDEVKRKRGFSGALVRSGYKVVKRLKKGRMIHEVLEGLLPEFVESIEPMHAAYREAPEGGFGPYLVAREDEASESLLSVTDKRAETTKHSLLRSTYLKLRPRASEHVKQALPALGDLIDKYTVSDASDAD